MARKPKYNSTPYDKVVLRAPHVAIAAVFDDAALGNKYDPHGMKTRGYFDGPVYRREQALPLSPRPLSHGDMIWLTRSGRVIRGQRLLEYGEVSTDRLEECLVTLGAIKEHADNMWRHVTNPIQVVA